MAPSEERPNGWHLPKSVPARSVSVEMELSKQEVDRHLKGRGGVWDLLVQRWEKFPRTANRETKTM